jgi:hypothetical protein
MCDIYKHEEDETHPERSRLQTIETQFPKKIQTVSKHLLIILINEISIPRSYKNSFIVVIIKHSIRFRGIPLLTTAL